MYIFVYFFTKICFWMHFFAALNNKKMFNQMAYLHNSYKQMGLSIYYKSPNILGKETNCFFQNIGVRKKKKKQ
ncbi:hypothetical protein [Plasmodium yoelii yoelii]|uniref:Uncharacterized protein n=1 Tax=Plasmodium yoelii yoelii TaxID=73239 RepID=Q7RDU1_PLAYO|nr:hypothetical protein [Plasmodium yoelii yoelii]